MPSLRNCFVCLSAVAVCVTLYLYSSGLLTPFSPALPTGRDDSASLSFAPSESATTGKLFTGKRVQKFPSELRSKSYHRQQPNTVSVHKPWCERWAVMTTIFQPTEAVRRQVRLPGWCLVVVGDKKTPPEYETGWIPGIGNKAVVFLSEKEQKKMNSRFVEAIPWNHFGRKNIGYLYAITHGAEVIWDFDDDNLLKYFIEGAAPDGAPSLNAAVPSSPAVHVLLPQNHSHPTLNPYPYLGAMSQPSWPRGIPLADIKVSKCSNFTLEDIKVNTESIGVLQSLADYQPDLDAIYRITMPNPFFFKRTNETRPLLVPRRVLTPYNAQATLHFKKSFWGLLLPITVHGRVSDIWRSYFAQRIFWQTNLQLGFLPRPLVVHQRNDHNNLGDLNGEQDLYMKSEHLVKFLSSWRGTGNSLPELIEELWVALYEHNYIDVKDVELVQLWLNSLIDIGFEFPTLEKMTAADEQKSQVTLLHQENKIISPSPEMCKTNRSLSFWTSDLHDGCRIDTPSALASLGHKVTVSGLKEGGPYPSVFEMKGISNYRLERSKVITKQYTTHSTKLSEQMIKDNFEFYKKNKRIQSTDAFICSFPASMCELWMPFNKTIVFLPAHRYNLGRCTAESWHRLNNHLQYLATMTNPRHLIGAMSVYDQEYLHHYTGLKPLQLFSYSGFYTAGNDYAPNRSEILLFGHNLEQYNFTKIQSVKVVNVKHLYPRYELSDLVKHRAVVYIAYSVMSYKLTELYSLAIPIFVPSIKFYKTVHRFGPDRSSLSSYYCKDKSLDKKMKPHPSSNHPYSPNIESDEDEESEYYWLQFSDFYQMPHITYFDDLQDLEVKLGKTEYNRIHQLMVAENEQRRKKLLDNWCRATKAIQTGRMVPQHYDQAIKKLYNSSRLQIS